MNKKNIAIIFILIIALFIGINISNKNEKYDSKNENESKKEYTHKDLNPISRESVINILKAEYGESVSVTVGEIKSVGDEYVVEVYIDLKDSEEIEEEHSALGEHTHRESLGEHRINMYTGEISEE
ncbi:MAG: hypothetical protein ACRC92_03940 [Peptostreptococcaceae bacterium]